MTTITTSVKLDDALKTRLKQLAVSRRRSVHWLMREAIAEYLDREEPPTSKPLGRFAADALGFQPRQPFVCSGALGQRRSI